MNTTTTTTALRKSDTEARIKRLQSLVIGSSESLMEAGRIVVELIGSGIPQDELATRSGFPRGLIDGLIKVGSAIMLPELLVQSSLWASRLKRAPISIQRLVMDKGVDLLLDDGQTLRAHPKDMTPAQVQQVFDGSQIRSLGGQRAFLESKSQETKKKQTLEAIPRESEFTAVMSRMERRIQGKELATARYFWKAALNG